MRVAVDAVSILRPSNVIVPDRAGTRPEMVLTRVDLPAPLAPTRVTISPARTVRSMSRITSTPP
jgi:hypothetical protein